ncbi:sugar kinase [Paenibacillaceae bacterium]|nr:sugar kinase [Paenibacillaceae bacterium]
MNNNNNSLYDVITFMDVGVDLIVRGGDIVPKFGQAEQLVADYAMELGGSCCIFAAQAAKLQLKTVGIGKVGVDPLGAFVLDCLQQSGIMMDYVQQHPGCKTGMGVALCDADDRAILTYPGTIDALGPEDIPNELFGCSRHLHIGSYYLMQKLQPHFTAIARQAKQHGMTVSLDTNWDPSERWDSGINELLPYVDIFLPNVNELKAITRQPTVGQAIEVLKDTVPLIVVKAGSEGAFAYHEGALLRAEPLKGLESIDSVGAGDSFDAGFIYGFLSGYDVQTCLQAGSICGGMSTLQSGGTAGQITLAEYLQLKDNVN